MATPPGSPRQVVSALVAGCAVKSLRVWSEPGEGVDVCMDTCGISLRYRGQNEFLAPWADVGFSGKGIVCSRLLGAVSDLHPIKITFQYKLPDSRKPTIVEINAKTLDAALKLLLGFETHMKGIQIQEPSAWPLPEITTSRLWVLKLYTPWRRGVFQWFSIFNGFTKKCLMLSALAQMLHIDQILHVDETVAWAWRLIAMLPPGVVLMVISFEKVVVPFFAVCGGFWILLQQAHKYIFLWSHVAKYYVYFQGMCSLVAVPCNRLSKQGKQNFAGSVVALFFAWLIWKLFL